MSSLNVKIVRGDDIRRVVIDTNNIADGFTAIQDTLTKHFGTGLSIKWEDDEGELITVSSVSELAEAARIANQEQRASLKLFVHPPIAPTRKIIAIDTTNAAAVNEVPSSPRSEQVVITDITQQELGSDAPQPSNTAARQPKKVKQDQKKAEQPSPPSHHELLVLLQSFLSDDEVRASLADAVQVLFATLNESPQDILGALEAVFAVCPAIEQHPLIVLTRPFLARHVERVSRWVPTLLGLGPDFCVSVLPRVLQQLPMLFGGARPDVHVDITDLFRNFFVAKKSDTDQPTNSHDEDEESQEHQEDGNEEAGDAPPLSFSDLAQAFQCGGGAGGAGDFLQSILGQVGGLFGCQQQQEQPRSSCPFFQRHRQQQQQQQQRPAGAESNIRTRVLAAAAPHLAQIVSIQSNLLTDVLGALNAPTHSAPPAPTPTRNDNNNNTSGAVEFTDTDGDVIRFELDSRGALRELVNGRFELNVDRIVVDSETGRIRDSRGSMTVPASDRSRVIAKLRKLAGSRLVERRVGCHNWRAHRDRHQATAANAKRQQHQQQQAQPQAPRCGRFGRGGGGRFGRWMARAMHDAEEAAINEAKEESKVSRLRVKYVGDVSLPDRTVVDGGQTLIKTWQLKNIGDTAWPEGTALIFVKGDESLVPQQVKFPVAAAAPGQTIQASAVINTPTKPGRYTAYFRLQTPNTNARNGRKFGKRVWVDLIVADNEQDVVEQVQKQDKNKNDKDSQEPQHVPDEDEEKSAEEEQDAVVSEPSVTVTEPTAQPSSADNSFVVVRDQDQNRFAQQIAVLDGMGFKDAELCAFLLDRHNGKVEPVVQWFLKNSGQIN